jgi:hypothetical protein
MWSIVSIDYGLLKDGLTITVNNIFERKCITGILLGKEAWNSSKERVYVELCSGPRLD